MKNKLIGFASLVFVTICVLLSFYAVQWYGNRIVDKTFPMQQIAYTLPENNVEHSELEDILPVFHAGNRESITTVTLDELETFTLMEGVHQQIALLYEGGILFTADYSNARPAILERYSLDDYEDTQIWMFVMSNEGEILTLFYHSGLSLILGFESSNLDYFTPDRSNAVKQAYLDYLAGHDITANVSVRLTDQKMVVRISPI